METKLSTLPNFSVYIDAHALETRMIRTQSVSPTAKFMMFFLSPRGCIESRS